MDVALEQQVWQRARRRCEYCQFSPDVSLLPFQLDHIIAEKHGGKTVLENLALSCERCNSLRAQTSLATWMEITSRSSIQGSIRGQITLNGLAQRCPAK